MSKNKETKVILRYRDEENHEHVLEISRLALVGVVGLAMTSAREAMTALEQEPLGQHLVWDGELAEESRLPVEQPTLQFALDNLRRLNEDYRATHRLMHYLRPKKEVSHGTV